MIDVSPAKSEHEKYSMTQKKYSVRGTMSSLLLNKSKTNATNLKKIVDRCFSEYFLFYRKRQLIQFLNT